MSQGARIPAVQARLRRQPAPAASAHTRRGLARSLVDWHRLARAQPQQQSIPRRIFITVPTKARLSRLAQARDTRQQPCASPPAGPVYTRGPLPLSAGCRQDMLAGQPWLCYCCRGRCGRPGDHTAGRAQPAASVCTADAGGACRPVVSLPGCPLAEALVRRVWAATSPLPTHAEHCARRYVAVYERGGWYIDSDASCMRPFDKWVPPGERADLVVGVEAERWPGHYQPVQVCCLEC